MRLVSAETFASATITSGANSMSRTVRMACAMRCAWRSDQKRKSSSSSSVLAPIPGSAEERGMSDGSESSARVTIFRSQQRIELKSRASGLSTIRASVISLGGWVIGRKSMEHTVNLYRPNMRNDVVLPVLVISNLSLVSHHYPNRKEKLKHLVFSCSPRQCILLKHNFSIVGILFYYLLRVGKW
jgi:hypothetical protein